MAAVAGRINQGVVPGKGPNVVEIANLDAIIQAVPEPAEEPIKEPDRGIGNI